MESLHNSISFLKIKYEDNSNSSFTLNAVLFNLYPEYKSFSRCHHWISMITARPVQQSDQINFTERYYSGRLGREGSAHLRVKYGARSDSNTMEYRLLLTGNYVWFSVRGRQENQGWGLKKTLQVLISDREVNKVGAESREMQNIRRGNQRRRMHMSVHSLHFPVSHSFLQRLQTLMIQSRCVCVCVFEFLCLYVIESMHRGQCYSAELLLK